MGKGGEETERGKEGEEEERREQGEREEETERVRRRGGIGEREGKKDEAELPMVMTWTLI